MFTTSPYVELHARSAFSFLRGASLPEQLAERAAQLDLPAMAVCDRDGVYGAPRVFAAARAQGIRPIVGAELTLADGAVLPLLVESRAGYQNLCRLLTRVHLRAEKGRSAAAWEDVAEFAEGLVALTGDEEGPLVRALERSPPSGGRAGADAVLRRLRQIFGAERLYIEVQHHRERGDAQRVRTLVELAERQGLPILATNGVRYAEPGGREVLDVFTCLRHHTDLDNAGHALAANSEYHLKPAVALEHLFRPWPSAVTNTLRLAERLTFSLEDLGYEFPVYAVPPGDSMDGFLREQTYRGARERYGTLTPRVRAQLEHELAVIAKLGFAGYFLIVWDLVKFCRSQDILVQGRGSAANSAVCYSLGITAVDPVGSDLLFERFLSEGREGWPDIDLDLPSGSRRERVIQEVYRRYGPHGAAMTANVITFRGRSAARELGKVLNLSSDVLDRFAHLFASGDYPHTLEVRAQLQQAGMPADHPRTAPFLRLYSALHGLPRHLGQHSGGMIICQGQLASIVPLENASLPGRVVAQWDKDDCADLGIIKVDLLGLGMMSVLQDALTLTRERGHPVELAQLPKDDPPTFALMQRADTIGVFQIESRAQMATLPRMQPRCFYDVVVEVAIIRPGPIQGDMVHPYLARRLGREPVDYLDARLKPVLERTLGIPLFQEQMLRIAMVMGDFTGGEAEELRRALSFHRSEERMQKVALKLRDRMRAQGVLPEVIERILHSITSFALYGFPESHAISFAILAYASAYLKVHYAPEFYAGLLNNQPMGFYSPATLVKDARRHGVRVRPVSVRSSDWPCTLEKDDALRLGFCLVSGLQRQHAEALVAARSGEPFRSMADLQARAGLNQAELRTLAAIGALNDLAAHRRAALWAVEHPVRQPDLFAPEPEECLLPGADTSPLAPMNPVERSTADYAGMGLTTGPHPMALVRSRLPGVWRACDLPRGRNRERVRIAGNVICRQRPGTAKGFVFVSLEDETGVANAVIAPDLFEAQRLVITEEPFLVIEGELQALDQVITVKARHIEPLRHDQLLAQEPGLEFREAGLGSPSHDFR